MPSKNEMIPKESVELEQYERYEEYEKCEKCPKHPKEELKAKVFCICKCDDLQEKLDKFLEYEINQKRNCIKPELIVSLGCKCSCGEEKVVLFYRETKNPCNDHDWK